jgi:predicted glycogen debranching enzyme
VTNGLGGYASGTVLGALTRRFHGLLIAALPTPFGRTMMFNHLSERLRWPDGRTALLNTEVDTPDGKEFDTSKYLVGFRLETGLPVWTFEIEGVRFEKRVMMPFLQNTTHIGYRLLSSEPIRLELRPVCRVPSARGAGQSPGGRAVRAPGAWRPLRDRAWWRPHAAAAVPARP